MVKSISPGSRHLCLEVSLPPVMSISVKPDLFMTPVYGSLSLPFLNNTKSVLAESTFSRGMNDVEPGMDNSFA